MSEQISKPDEDEVTIRHDRLSEAQTAVNNAREALRDARHAIARYPDLADIADELAVANRKADVAALHIEAEI